MHWDNEPECVSSHCTVWLPSYMPEEVGTLVHLPRWVYTIAREACLFPLPSFVRGGHEHGAVHFVSVLQLRQLSWVFLILSSRNGQMEIVRVYALHSHSEAAAGRHLSVARAEGQSITHFQHVLLTPVLSA